MYTESRTRGLRPFFSPKYDLKKHPNYKYTAEADKKRNAFYLEKLISTLRREMETHRHESRS
nr:hypothetical protein [Blautia pseudococcoides]